MHLRTAGPLASLLLLALAAAAQPATPPSLEQPRLGFPGGPDAGRSRNGAWAPVTLIVKGGAEGNGQNTYQVSLQTTDSEGAPSRTTVPVPALAANDQRTLMGYVRPGSDGSDLTVQLETLDGRVIQSLPRLQRDASTFKNEIILPRQVFYLTLGARLPGLRRAGKAAPKPAKEKEEGDEEEANEGDSRSFGFVESVAGMPDQWFGYEAVDVVVLATGSEGFVDELFQEGAAPQRLALLEWVRRGGHLVLSVGRNYQRVARLLEKLPLVRCTLTGSVTRPSLNNVAVWTGRGADKAIRQAQVANLEPGPHVHVIIREEAEGSDKERPVLVQTSCGLGRVILAAFDLDLPPFSTWDGQHDFWTKLQGEIAPLVPAQRNEGGFSSESHELGAETKRILETFEEVPVISFGWVALFILVYIIIVGPLDYFILKKVFKRLELTWVTFPAVVLIVSVAAYCLAYSLKGDDIRINKIDVVDIDLGEPQRVYGTTWFSLFSPRIQSYTVGLEPAAPEWAAPAAEGEQRPPAMVATLDAPELSLGSTSQGLFRRPYDYAPAAAGIQRMPIPVWATRSFTASWEAPLPAGRPPIEAQLRRSRDGTALFGDVINHLPLDLHDVILFYRGKGYKLGDLMPGEPRPVNALFERGVQPLEPAAWLSEDSLRPRLTTLPAKQQSRSWFSWSSYRLMKPLMFYAETGGNGQYNSNLRRLDQSWRLDPQTEVPAPLRPRYREEVVLVARTAVRADRAEEVTQSGVASRLWLDALPGGTAPRPSLPGYLTQETYVRVYVPLQGAP